MQEETNKNMNQVSVKSSEPLDVAVERVAREMISEGLDEKPFNIKGTKIEFILILKGSESENKRKSDPASTFGLSYKVDGKEFILARR